MRRFGSILGMAGPAILLTVLVQPIVRQTADLSRASSMGRAIPIMAPVAFSAPILLAAVERPAPEIADGVVAPPAQSGHRRASSKPPRRLMKEGCEGAISSLAGPEARRMVPGRCIA